jgi:N-acetylglutamate synthase-like GNAT family acetyltransferase
MTFDAAAAVRMITNNRLRTAQGWGEYRDLQGALAVTSDAPIAELNCLGDFSTDERNIESLLDIGFGLLRAFDREPAAEVTQLDRPASIAEHLQLRGLAIASRRSWMAFRGDGGSIPANAGVEVRVAEPDDARTFAALHGGDERWVKRLSLSTTLSGMLEPGNTFYLGYIDGQAVATLHLLLDGATAGIYAVGTAKAYRRRGVSSTLMARAIVDARTAGCDLVCLSTEASGYAEGWYATLGFETAFESALWTMETRG